MDMRWKFTERYTHPWNLHRCGSANSSGHNPDIPARMPAREKVKLQKRSMKHAYDDDSTLKGQDIRAGKILM